jgi:hypothetical protein
MWQQAGRCKQGLHANHLALFASNTALSLQLSLLMHGLLRASMNGSPYSCDHLQIMNRCPCLSLPHSSMSCKEKARPTAPAGLQYVSECRCFWQAPMLIHPVAVGTHVGKERAGSSFYRDKRVSTFIEFHYKSVCTVSPLHTIQYSLIQYCNVGIF